MAGLARVVVPGIPHHVTQRGNRRLETFFKNDDDRAYLDLLAASCAGRPPGSSRFVERLERRLGRPLLPRKPGPKPTEVG